MDDCTFDFAVTGSVPRSDSQIRRAKSVAVGGGRKRCRKGKSCSATCIYAGKICLVDLPEGVSGALSKVRGRIQKGAPLTQDEKSQAIKGDLGAMFANAIQKGKKEQKPASLPSDLRRELFALPGPKNSLDQARERHSAAQKGKDPVERWEARKALAAAEKKAGVQQAPVEGRKLEKSPGANERTAPEVRRELANIVQATKKGDMTLMMDDISRIMRGSLPQNLEVASAGNELGLKARLKGSGTQAGSATGNTRWARNDAGDFDGAFKIYKRIRGDKDMIDWSETVKNGKQLGEGSFGTVIRVGNVAHKRGEVGEREADIIKKVGLAGIGPRLLGAEISTKKREGYGVNLHNGRIAMTVVPGEPIGKRKADDEVAGKKIPDIYWKAMADLHRLGIAHNDAHVDNILIDKNGKGRWVDLGLAQDNPKAALAEALGAFKHLRGGDDITVPGSARGDGNFQVRKWNATGYQAANKAREKGGEDWKEFERKYPVTARVWNNQNAVIKKLEKSGLDINDINSMIEHGIRSPLSSYDDSSGYSRLTNKQAQDLLNTLYDGI
jgi:hypothetical protein